MFETLTTEQKAQLEELIFNLEFNPDHEDDYFNAGGFSAHWQAYTEAEQTELINTVKKGN